MFLNLGSSHEEDILPACPAYSGCSESGRNSLFEEGAANQNRGGTDSVIGAIASSVAAGINNISSTVFINHAGTAAAVAVAPHSRRSFLGLHNQNYKDNDGIKPSSSDIPGVECRIQTRVQKRAYVCCWRRSSLRLMLFLLSIALYFLLGAVAFLHLETPVEQQEKIKWQTKREQFLQKHPCLPDKDLEELISEIVLYSSRGVSPLKNISDIDTNWSFEQSLFFVTTVLTTIGYGRTTPLSDIGKGFCILYSIFGIPLTLVMFSAIVERLHVISKKLLRTMYRKLQKRMRHMSIRILHMGVVVFLLLLLFYLLPSLIFIHMEHNWSFLDALYYCFISLTTIGLGDYVPGERVPAGRQDNPFYKLFITAYLLLGLIFTLFTLRVFHDIPELNVGYYIYMSSDDSAGTKSLCLCCCKTGKDSVKPGSRNSTAGPQPYISSGYMSRGFPSLSPAMQSKQMITKQTDRDIELLERLACSSHTDGLMLQYHEKKCHKLSTVTAESDSQQEEEEEGEDGGREGNHHHSNKLSNKNIHLKEIMKSPLMRARETLSRVIMPTDKNADSSGRPDPIPGDGTLICYWNPKTNTRISAESLTVFEDD